VVNGERCTFRDGEYVVFDYTLPHYSKNEGSDDRIVLLMIIDPALVRKRP
jgi:aspartyl/asparaginyl beta-hydroxylase (cupin superfamily)